MIQDGDEYRKLIEALRERCAEFDAADGERRKLAVSLHALQDVLRCLLGHPEVKDERLTRPLIAIHSALHNAGRGANPALLAHAPDPPGKPSGTMREYVQGHLAFALELLIAAKMGTGAAAERVANEVRGRVVAEDGAPITDKQIVQWRKDIRRGKAPAKVAEQFEELRSLYSHVIAAANSEEKRHRVKTHAGTIIANLANLAPRDAPRRIGR